MSDEEIARFMYLFRKYRDDGELPDAERVEFRALAAKWRKLKGEGDDAE